MRDRQLVGNIQRRSRGKGPGEMKHVRPWRERLKHDIDPVIHGGIIGPCRDPKDVIGEDQEAEHRGLYSERI
jgi:hypothetical protein